MGVLRSQRMKLAVIVVGILAGGGVAFLVTRISVAASPPPFLSSVSAATLAANGVTLNPTLSSASVSAAAAQHTAAVGFPGSQVRETVLAQVSDPTQRPTFDRLCWAVSLTPPPGSESHGPPGSIHTPMTYLVAFIDAQTGKLQFAIGGGGKS